MSRLDSEFESLIKLGVIIPILAYIEANPKTKYTMQELWVAVKGEPTELVLTRKSEEPEPEITEPIENHVHENGKKPATKKVVEPPKPETKKVAEPSKPAAPKQKAAAPKPETKKDVKETKSNASEDRDEAPKKCIHVVKKRTGGQMPCPNFALTGSTWCKTHGKGKEPAKTESDENLATPAQPERVRLMEIPDTPYSKEPIHGFITQPKVPGKEDGPHEAICVEKEGKLCLMDKQDRLRALGVGLNPIPEASYHVLFEEVCNALKVQ